jgi:hypothetical protein
MRKFYCHTSNENTFNGKVVGSMLKAGRSWLRLGRRSLNCEWYFLNRARNGFSLKVDWGSGDGEDGITLHAAVPYLFSIFISLEGVFGKLFRYPNETRTTGIAFHHGAFWFYPFAKTNSWSSRDRWYNKSTSFSIVDFICGRNKYAEENVQSWKDIVITMPEGKYKGKLRLYTGTWKNRFRTLRIPRGEIEMEEGIPFPGKGENSWDCGEDATYGMTCPAQTEEEAICALIQSVMRNRRRYGCWTSMFDYKPVEKHVRCTENKEAPKACEASEASC